jgi:hypothetical protein
LGGLNAGDPLTLDICSFYAESIEESLAVVTGTRIADGVVKIKRNSLA